MVVRGFSRTSLSKWTTKHDTKPINCQLRKHLSFTFLILMANGIAFSALYDHLYCRRSPTGVLVGCSDSRVALWKVRGLVTCSYYLVGNDLVRAVLGGLDCSHTTCLQRANEETTESEPGRGY